MSAIENINPRIRVETIKSNEVSYSRIKDTSTSSIIVIPYTISKIGESTAKIEEIFVRDHKNAFTNERETTIFVINSEYCESESDACRKFVSRSLSIPESKIPLDNFKYLGELSCNVSSFSANFSSYAVNVTGLKSVYGERYELNALDAITPNTNQTELPNDMIIKVSYHSIISGKYKDILLNGAILNFAANMSIVTSVENIKENH